MTRGLMWICWLAGLLLIVGASGCDTPTGSDRATGGKLTIACTTGMIADIVREVAGDAADVHALMGAGVDPHLYKPTRSDIIRLEQADVVFYNGLNLEGKMSDLFIKLARKGKPVYAVTDLIDGEGYVLTDEMEHFDPHVWMDVQGWMHAVRAVAAALADVNPERADDYAAHADKYLGDLQSLDDYARSTIASIPEPQRVLITAHDAFGYFGRAYGIDVRGIQGMSTESEAGVRDINELVDFIVENDIAAVFVETSVADKNVRALIEGAASRGKTVRIGGSLYSDAMGSEGTYEGTYFGMIDHNVTTVARALGGDAPERGLNGKLAAPRGGSP